MEQLLATFGRELQAVAYLILGSRADAEEVVIDTMMTAWRKASDLREPDALRGWLLRITTRHALSRRRRLGTALFALPDDPGVSSQPGPSIERIAMLEALESLPRQVRAAIVLHYFADLTVDQTAATLGKRPNTIKAQIQDGLGRLRARLGEDGTTDG